MKLAIGEKIYKNGFMCYLEYRIDGIRLYKDNTVYEATCLSCTHGYKCKVLLCQTNGKIEFAGMVDHEEDDTQHYMHNMEGFYYKTLGGAKRARLSTLICEKEKRIEQLKKELALEENRLFEFKDAYSIVRHAK